MTVAGGRYSCGEATDRTGLGGFMAKVLFYDIETAPNLAYVWGKYQQDAIEIPRSWYMMAFGYKWKVKFKVLALPDFELYATDPDNDRGDLQRLCSCLMKPMLL